MSTKLCQTDCARDDEVVREDREGVHLHVVAAPLAAVELYVELLLRAVGHAEEARPGHGGLRVDLGCGAGNSAGVMLRFRGNAAHGQILHFRDLQRAEVGGCQRPHRQLVLDEFGQFVGHRSARILSL